MKTLITLSAALLALSACSSKDGDFSYEDFEGGTFQFTTEAVDDVCYDGAFSVIFMPEGSAEDWGTTTELPAWADLPSTYSIDLQDPFSGMEITVAAGATGQMLMTGALQEDVELDADSYPGCLVDMLIDAELDVIDADTVQGAATLNTSSFDESGCPAVSADPCDITLDLSAIRL